MFTLRVHVLMLNINLYNCSYVDMCPRFLVNMLKCWRPGIRPEGYLINASVRQLLILTIMLRVLKSMPLYIHIKPLKSGGLPGKCLTLHKQYEVVYFCVTIFNGNLEIYKKVFLLSPGNRLMDILEWLKTINTKRQNIVIWSYIPVTIFSNSSSIVKISM